MGFIIAIHVLVCIFLIIMILIQQGKGGGLIDNLSSMESVLGTKTNAFLTKTTSVLAILFFLTCLSLAFLSLKQSRSLMRQMKPSVSAPQAAKTAKTVTQETAKTTTQETAKTAAQETATAPQAAKAASQETTKTVTQSTDKTVAQETAKVATQEAAPAQK